MDPKTVEQGAETVTKAAEEPDKKQELLVMSDVRFQNISVLVGSDLRRRFLKFYKRVEDKKDRDFGVEYGAWLAYMVCQEINIMERTAKHANMSAEIAPTFLAVLNHVLPDLHRAQVEPIEEKPEDVGTDTSQA